MLRGPRSLALRASIIFTLVFGAIILSIVVVGAAFSWADRGAGNLRGPVIAVDYAAEDLRFAGGRLQLARDGRFAGLAARNARLWLIAVKDGRAFTAGPVPEPALHTVAELQNTIDSVVLRLPGEQLPLAAGALQRRDLPFGETFIAAGGVHPATLSTRESLHLLFEPEVLLGLLAIALISLLAMLIAVPSFVRALAPITREAAAIGPGGPGRRLDEGKAPTELLPLVGGFNAALDRLEIELGRRKRFIADVAHELRTPLAVVSLQAESLADGDAKADLQRGLKRLAQLVAQMLDLERLSVSAQQRVSFDLIAVARDVVADLAPLAIAKGYELSLADPGAGVTASGDVQAATRALTNLIGNAIAHAGGTGAIIVCVGADRTITVADEGPGIAQELAPRLFEPFSRGHSDTDGSGLGLHLTREIMSAHGGDVCLIPTGRGAMFRLRFPQPDQQD